MAVGAAAVTAEILERPEAVDDAGAYWTDQNPGYLEET
jgi:hypothetical protein